MIAKNLKKLKANVAAGKNTEVEENALARKIDKLVEEELFIDLGVDVAFRICSKVAIMKAETATLLFQKFFSKYQENSLKLIAAINCGPIAIAVYDVLAPFLAFPLLRETTYTLKQELNYMEVDWEGAIALRDSRIKELEEDVARLNTRSEAESEPIIIPKKPADFIADIHDASKKGDSESVAFLLWDDKSQAEKKNEIDQF
jgi:hypothetical protein